MTYSIVYDAVQIKMNRFEKPAPLINTNEVAAAMCICCRQAKLTPPELTAGMRVGEARDIFFKAMEHATGVQPQLLAAIREYPQEDQRIDDTAKKTYDFGLTYPN